MDSRTRRNSRPVPPEFPSGRGPTMLMIWGRRQPHCDGITRRNFLQVGAFGTVSLAALLRARATQAAETRAAAPTTTPKAAIMIYLPGGPSHIDMYDLK